MRPLAALALSFSFFAFVASPMVQAEVAEEASDLRPIDVYEQDFLLELISRNRHLQQIQQDDCQIVDDIRYRAEHARYPSFQYLYGDMLLFGICVDKDIGQGWSHINSAAAQGLPEANEMIGRYYATGRLVQKSPERALPYLRLAASQDNLKAQLRYVDLLNQGYGTVHEYVQAYHWLYNALIDDPDGYRQATEHLAYLETRMNRRMLQQARQPRRY